jgi:hypothetical protein
MYHFCCFYCYFYCCFCYHRLPCTPYPTCTCNTLYYLHSPPYLPLLNPTHLPICHYSILLTSLSLLSLFHLFLSSLVLSSLPPPSLSCVSAQTTLSPSLTDQFRHRLTDINYPSLKTIIDISSLLNTAIQQHSTHTPQHHTILHIFAALSI